MTAQGDQNEAIELNDNANFSLPSQIAQIPAQKFWHYTQHADHLFNLRKGS